MVKTGWVEDELPAGREARELSEILTTTPGWAEREAERAEQAQRDEQLAQARERADSAEARAWIARMRGQELPDAADVLARTTHPGPGSDDRQRRRQAREILRQYDLEDVITGAQSGVVFDQYLGVLEPAHATAQRSAPDLDRETLQRAEDDRRWMTGYIQRTSGSPRPFARRSQAARSEYCVYCTEENLSDETSYLLHSDPELNCPVTTPAEKAEADRKQAQADRLEAEGFTPQTSRYAAGLAIR